MGGFPEGDGDINSPNLMTEPASVGMDALPTPKK